MKENKIDADLLNKSIIVTDASDNSQFTLTIDELLYLLAANDDYVDDEVKLSKGHMAGSIEANDDYEPTSRNAVMFGNMLSSNADVNEKEQYEQQDREMKELLENNDPLATQLLALGKLDRTPGTTAYMARCKGRFLSAITKAKDILREHPELEGFMQLIAKDYATQYERMNEVSVDVFNTPVHRVKAYVPLNRIESNGETLESKVKEDLLSINGISKKGADKGMTMRRVSIPPLYQKPVEMGLYKTWSNSVERTEHFIHYSAYVRELNRVYKSKDSAYTNRFIENRYGKYMMDYIKSYINEVANPNADKVRSAGDDIIRTLRGNTAPAYLAWKASAIIKQGLTSPWPYMQFVNPAEYLKAAWKLTTSRGEGYEAIREKSVFMKNRVMDPMNDLVKEMSEAAAGNKLVKNYRKINAKGMAGLEWIDWICVAPGWLACYEQEKNRITGTNQEVYEATKIRLNEENALVDVASSQWKTQEQIEAAAMQAMVDDVEKRAVEYADNCTRQCQPSNRAADIAPLFKNSSEAWKAYLQFQTSLNVIWNNIRYDLPYAVKNKQFYRIAGCITGYVAAGIMMNAVMEGWSNDDDDKEGAALRDFIYYSTTQFTDSVPMIGNILTNTTKSIITQENSFFGNNGVDMTPMISKFAKAATSTNTALTSDDPEKAKKAWINAAVNFAEGVNMNAGLPTSGVREIMKLTGIGDGDGELEVDLGSVYGIVNNITGKEN